MTLRSSLIFISILGLGLWSCKESGDQATSGQANTDTAQPAAQVKVPDFNADTAYNLVAKQVAFGPRVPGTPAQKQCAAWMETMLKGVTDTVYKQQVQVRTGNGKMIPCINLVGAINPNAAHRVLLLTHWDSRPWADMDTKDTDKPILAADDAGSGVAVLLELARQIKSQPLPPNLGIDIFFTDAEDYGKDTWGDSSYCLGTQYWALHPHVPGYRADYGILLDMVGARNARFTMEGLSAQVAGDVQKNVWEAANRAGYSSFFPFTAGSAIIDDHEFVNKLANIPTIDIINLAGNGNEPFAPHWHTHKDNMDIIDRTTLKAVGQTLLQVIYESAHQL
ncbi:M28 family peptidase [Chitinophagaceae bacterium MMS25-I14]